MQATADSLIHKDPASNLLYARFKTSPEAVLTLYQVVSGGLEWQKIFNALWDVNRMYGLVFLMYIFYVLLAFYNVVTGLFSNSFTKRSATIDQNKKNEAGELLLRVAEICEWVGDDGIINKNGLRSLIE